jgi:hypothetical protein
MIVFTNEVDLIAIETISKEAIANMRRFINQIDDSKIILNLKHTYDQQFMYNDDLINVDSASSSSFDAYIMIIDVDK